MRSMPMIIFRILPSPEAPDSLDSTRLEPCIRLPIGSAGTGVRIR
jgi:hypothetical protein